MLPKVQLIRCYGKGNGKGTGTLHHSRNLSIHGMQFTSATEIA